MKYLAILILLLSVPCFAEVTTRTQVVERVVYVQQEVPTRAVSHEAPVDSCWKTGGVVTIVLVVVLVVLML